MELFSHLARLRRRADAGQSRCTRSSASLLGTLIGVLPGIGPVATIAMLLPTTYALQPVSALIMLAGIYYGAQYGGSTTAILVNMPGEIVVGRHLPRRLPDGAQGRGRRGARDRRAGLVLRRHASPRCFVAAVSLPLSELALKFGPAEYFSLMVLGLIGAVVLAHGSLLKAIAMIILGLLLGIVGTDVNSGVARFDFGIPELVRRHRRRRRRDGPVRLRRDHHQPRVDGEARELVTTQGQGPVADRRTSSRPHGPPCCAARCWARSWACCPAAARCCRRSRRTAIEKKIAKDPSQFGKGAIQGVAGPESANNAGAQTSFIPLLTLGIPENAVMAMMVGAMTIHNIQPGPQVMTSAIPGCSGA